MTQTTLSVRMDKETKKQFDAFCSEVGMNASVAVNLFAKTVVRERRIPFEIAAPDPFYTEKNMARLRAAARRMEENGGIVHEPVEVEDD